MRLAEVSWQVSSLGCLVFLVLFEILFGRFG